MIKKIAAVIPVCIIGLLLFIACNSSDHNTKGVEEAMKHLDELTLKVDGDSIALLYTPDGKLGNVAQGRDSIRKFLATFKNVRVLSQSSTTKSIEMNKDTAVQKGEYHQSDIINGKDTVHVKGEFTATWVWMKNQWLIKEMQTKPID